MKRDTSGTLLARGLYCMGLPAAVAGVAHFAALQRLVYDTRVLPFLVVTDILFFAEATLFFSRSALALFVELLFLKGGKRGKLLFLLFSVCR